MKEQEIFNLVTKYYHEHHEPKTFIPGISNVPYGGRIYDIKELISLVDSALEFWLTAGHFAEEFETSFASFLNAKHCMLTNSGSSANLLAISALTSPLLCSRQLIAGDEVITTALSFPTTINPIVQNGLIPVFIDVDINTHNIDVSKIESVITPKTKAIFLAHTLGNPFNLNAVTRIARKYNLFLVEDNCDALGSKYNNQYTGTFGDISTYSFYPAHHITMGEGGALVTNNPLLKRIIESFRDWGRDCQCPPGVDNKCGSRFNQQHGEMPFGYDHKYVYSHIGYNLKITEMQAAIGVEQLKKLPSFIAAREKNFNILYTHLKKYSHSFNLPMATINSSPSWFGFPLTITPDASFTRNEIVLYLESHKIATRMLFAGNITKQPAFKNIQYKQPYSLHNTDYIMENTFWIGIYPGITQPMLDYVLSVFDNFMIDK